MAIDLKSLKKNQSYSAIAPVSELLDDLNELAVMDKDAEHQLKHYGTLRLGLIVGAIVVAFLASLFLFYVGLIALVGLLGAVIWVSIQRAKYVGLDLPDERYQFAQEITNLLARDMTPEQLVQLDVGFRSALAAENKTNSQPHPKRSGWTLDSYQHDWFKVQGGFADGTRFSLALMEMFQHASGYKRSASGKRKYKSKTKSKGTTLDLQLFCPRKRYGALDVLRNDAEKAVQMLPGVRLKRCRVTPKGLAITLLLPPDATASMVRDSLIKLLLSAYQVLNLAQQLSQKSKPPKKSKKRKRNGGRIGA